MENLKVEGNWKSPYLEFNQDGNFKIWGRSLPENALEIYKPAFEWLEAYAKAPAEHTKVQVELEYFNTSSSKIIFELFKKFEILHKEGKKINIKWYYENDDLDLRDEGELYSELITVPIELIGVDEFSFTF